MVSGREQAQRELGEVLDSVSLFDRNFHMRNAVVDPRDYISFSFDKILEL